jgi:chromosome segregation ATPase
MAVETKIESIFVCTSDEHETPIVFTKEQESADCPQCGHKMENIGWTESDVNRAEKVDEIVSKFLNPLKEAAPSISEGGVEVGTTEEVTKSATAPETEEVEEVTAEEETTEEEKPEVDETEGTEEEAAEVVEVTDEETEISKKIEELQTAITGTLEKNRNEVNATVEELKVKVDEATEQFVAKASELESKLNEFGEKLEVSKSRLADLEIRLEKVNAGETLRKSADLDESPTAGTNVQKGTTWNGAFSGRI